MSRKNKYTYSEEKAMDYKVRMNKESAITDSLVRQKIAKNIKYRGVKITEIEYIKEKYSLNQNQAKCIANSYLTKSKIPSGSISKLDKLFEYILKNIYEYSDEEIINYMNKNYLLFIYTYDLVKLKIIIFNHFGLLDIIIDNPEYLKDYFPRGFIGCNEIYAILMSNNINNIKQLKGVYNSIYNEELALLTRKYVLTEQIKNDLEKELISRINKQVFMLKLKQRRELKKQS